MVERTSAAPRSQPCTAARTAQTGRTASMTRPAAVARRAEELLGAAVVATAPVAGGDISTATRLRLSDGTHRADEDPRRTRRRASSRPRPRAALARRGRGRRAVPEVLGVDRRLPDPALGRARQGQPPTRPPSSAGALAATARGRRGDVRRSSATASSAGCRCPTRPPTRGRSSSPSAGCCPTSSSPATAARSSRPRRAAVEARRSAGSPTCCPRSRRPGSTATSGTATCSGAPTAPCWLIDPAAHGGHRETDLAMLALFGLPHLPRVLDGVRRGHAARRRLGGRLAAAPAVPAARARLPVRRRRTAPARPAAAARYA